MATRRMKNKVERLEEGDIFLLDWPKTNDDEMAEVNTGMEGERFYLLMHPTGWRHHRLIHISKKSLDQSDKDSKHYGGVVDEIVRSDRDLEEHLAAVKDENKRHCCHPPMTLMRLVGMGEYQLLRDGSHTQLVYELAPPQPCNGAEQEFMIGASTTYIIGVKNPPPQDVTSKDGDAGEAPQQSQGCYNGHGFLNADPPELLNQEGAEILLISTGTSTGADKGK